MSSGEDRLVRVVLYKHGMGFFERRARVEGDALLRLSFRHNEMDDVLKSLVFADTGGGRLVSVSYDPHPDLAKTVDDIRVSLPEDGGLVALLAQLRGAEVALRIRGVGEELRGRVLGVESVDEAHGDAVVANETMSLAVGDSLRRVRMAEVEDVRPLEAALSRDLAALLERSDASRRSERRRLSLHLRGEGEREVSVAYSVPATVWKTSYRILFEDETRPRLLGFAVVDNDSPEDWEGVNLSLVSGLPVSFTHDLYSPRRRARPHVRAENEAPIAPPVLERVFDVAPAGGDVAMACDEGEDLEELGELEETFYDAPAGAATPTPLGSDLSDSLEVATHTEEQGDLFRYDVAEPISIKSGHSALVPILNEEVEGEIVAVYNPTLRRGNPISSFRIENTSELMLEGGPATVLRAGEYAGEAMLSSLRQGDETLVPFSVELGCRVTTAFDSRQGIAQEVRISDGKLRLVAWSQRITTYTVRNTTQRKLSILIDHPANRQNELVDTPDPVERTERFDRFPVEVEAGAQIAFPVTERHEHIASHVIQHTQLARQVVLVQSIGAPPELVTLLGQLEPIAARLAESETEVAMVDIRVQEIGKQHDRIRKNLGELGSESQKERDLRERYIDALDSDETRLEELASRRSDLVSAIADLTQEFSERAAEISFG